MERESGVWSPGTHSPFAFLPIETLMWDLISLSTTEIFERIHRELVRQLDSEFDLKLFQETFYGRKNLTARSPGSRHVGLSDRHALDAQGIRNFGGERPDVRLVLVEGHQRHRYLNALYAHGQAPAGPHDVFVLSSPVAA